MTPRAKNSQNKEELKKSQGEEVVQESDNLGVLQVTSFKEMVAEKV